ncbi:nucleotide exchange factor GrpE [Actinocorallia sp. API 0066]|uniref:nucleotide exchange factor GrpE n=1 Tax=Actinocorallia sp. API 0066 TaxID=2896846 RepID=UPI001E574615|nr:nucleotide exchange factor GrpE [Actinocorallia sp. API 0066]MCD0448717.1 nucleotide exchange factor GrpE [Actinocorallia sp. API 0066]
MSSAPGVPPEGQPVGQPEGRHAPTLAELCSALSGLTAMVGREHERARHREEIIDRLHRENESLRRGELDQLHEPVRAALYRLYDLVRRAEVQPPDGEHVAPLLGMIGDELAEALGRTGVEIFEVEFGEPYDSARHRPLGVEPVTDRGLDGKVVEVCREGFARGDVIVRRAQVRVGKYRED